MTRDGHNNAYLSRPLHTIVGCLDNAFPGRIRAIYLDGSHADRTAIAASDLDLTIVFAGQFQDTTERERAEGLVHRWTSDIGGEFDVSIEDEASLAAGITPMLKFGSRLVHGEEIRAALPLVPLAEWTRERVNAAYWLMIRVFNRPVPVVTPLAFPDPADPFFGYANRTVRLPNGAAVASTRDLIRVTGWIATARLAWEAGQYVARKRDCHERYRQWIGDAWSDLLVELYAQCRDSWGYYVPEDAAGQAQLRALCTRTLAFENDFLTRYKAFLLREMRENVRFAESRAVWVLTQLPLCDAEIREALAARAAGTASEDAAVTRALHHLRAVCQ